MKVLGLINNFRENQKKKKKTGNECTQRAIRGRTIRCRTIPGRTSCCFFHLTC